VLKDKEELKEKKNLKKYVTCGRAPDV